VQVLLYPLRHSQQLDAEKYAFLKANRLRLTQLLLSWQRTVENEPGSPYGFLDFCEGVLIQNFLNFV
jgi:hypothetical protein